MERPRSGSAAPILLGVVAVLAIGTLVGTTPAARFTVGASAEDRALTPGFTERVFSHCLSIAGPTVVSAWGRDQTWQLSTATLTLDSTGRTSRGALTADQVGSRQYALDAGTITAFRSCMAAYPIDQRIAESDDAWQRRQLWWHYAHRLIPCLAARGIIAPELPPLDRFATMRYSSYDPYAAAGDDLSDAVRLLRSCPPAPPAVLLRAGAGSG